MSPHLGAAYNLARWLARSHEDAEDIVQESFLRAYSGYDGFRGGDPKAWLLAVVRNTAMTWLKKNRNPAMQHELVMDARDPNTGPEGLVLKAADREKVRGALEQLPVEFREVVVLREFEELSYREIATISGVPLGTVMSRLSRGREWLRRFLTSPEEGGA